MKVNKITDLEWTENLGLCVELPADGIVVAVQLPKQDDALLSIIHESVHVWQAIMRYMGEDNPGIEAEAYTIEHISKELMLQYQLLTGEQLAVHDKRKTRLQKGEPALQQPS